ncbi:MAG: YybH family protein [Bacteroidota bacterium]
MTYAADGAVLHREGRLIEGRQAIAAYYEQRAADDARLEWTPDFVEVAASGDLGYTYGKFIYEGKDRAGQVIKREGIFHTVWKRSANGVAVCVGLGRPRSVRLRAPMQIHCGDEYPAEQDEDREALDIERALIDVGEELDQLGEQENR